MSSRVYPKELFDEIIISEKLKLLFCPYCYKNNLSSKNGNLIIIGGYNCKNCNKIIDENEAINRAKMRDIKINKILGKAP